MTENTPASPSVSPPSSDNPPAYASHPPAQGQAPPGLWPSPQDHAPPPGFGPSPTPNPLASDRPALFGPHAVGAATFVGSPVAGGITLALNATRLNRQVEGLAYVGGGIALTAIIAGIVNATGNNLGSALGFALAFGAFKLTSVRFGADITTNEQSGATVHAAGLGALIGLPFLIFGLAAMFGVFGDSRTVIVDRGYTLRVAEEVDESTARDVSAMMQRFNAFVGGDLFFDHDENSGLIVSAVVNEGWDELPNPDALGQLFSDLISAWATDEQTVVFRVMDPNQSVQDSWTSTGVLGTAVAWGDDDNFYDAAGLSDEDRAAAIASLDEASATQTPQMNVRLHRGADDQLRACLMIVEQNLELPNIAAQVVAILRPIPGVTGFDVCTELGPVHRAIE